jgi:uncharacterized protein (TIGR00255 family)
MIKSMTGFASLTHDDERGTIGVTVRAVNHRFLDLQLRLPPGLAELEPRVRTLVQSRLGRGRVEVQLSVQSRLAPAPDVQINVAFARALGAAIATAREEGLVEGRLTPGDLLRHPQALVVREKPAEESLGQPLAAAAEGALQQALDALDRMRTHEGGHLAEDLRNRRALLADLITKIAAAAERGRAQLEARLLERAREVAAQLPLDQALLAQEVVRVAQRSDITEEVTRFRGHLDHWDALTGGEEPCGRKLDFLLQEMNREINTIGSKADGLDVSELVILAKAELERMREQVQNVE